MSKLTRAIQKLFGSTSGSAQLSVFGSLAAGSPAFSSDPVVIQSLANYLAGWPGAVIGGNSPAIEDLNSLCYLYSRQLAYLFQEGVAEFDGSTTYFLNSVFQSGGSFYQVTYGSASGVTGVTPPNGSFYMPIINTPVYVLTPSCGNDTHTPSGTTVIANLSGTINVFNNAPVELQLLSDGSGSVSFISIEDNSGSPQLLGAARIFGFRNGTQFAQHNFEISTDSGSSTVLVDTFMQVPSSTVKFVDFNPGSGPNIYDIRVAVVRGTFVASNVKLLIKQMLT